MSWLSYECFSILYDAFLLKSVISSHNSCEEVSYLRVTLMLSFLSLMIILTMLKQDMKWSTLTRQF